MKRFCTSSTTVRASSGKRALTLLSATRSGPEISDLLTLIYYPKEKLKLLGAGGRLTKAWYNDTLHDLIDLSRVLSSKYTRSKVRKATPSAYAYILDELLHALPDEDDNQLVYHQKIIDTLIDIGSGDEFIVALCGLIKRLAVDRLHIVGDIYDRGPHADGIMDLLLNHHAVDIEWGNHDILWMGAASGNPVCMAAVVRGCLQYDNMELLETGYGISLRSLALFASQTYPSPVGEPAALQAITVLLFKLEGQLIARHPEYGMDGRRLLHRLLENGESLSLGGQTYPLKRMELPTLDPADPYRLTAGEEAVLHDLSAAFAKSERLRRHVRFLYDNGRLYRCYNGNLLFHGCIPMTEDGDFAQVTFDGECYQGRALMDHHERMARRAYFDRDPEAVDFMWYLWCGERSPLCGRSIKTFERAFVNSPEAWAEPMNPYYRHINDEGRLPPHPERLRPGFARSAHHQRPYAHSCQQRRKPRQGQWTADRDRRRFLQGVSEGDGHRGIHADFQLARPAHRGAPAFFVPDARARRQRRYPF